MHREVWSRLMKCQFRISFIICCRFGTYFYKATMNFQTSPERSSLEICGSIVIIYFMGEHDVNNDWRPSELGRASGLGFLSLIHSGSEFPSSQHSDVAGAFIMLTDSAQICHARHTVICNHRLISRTVNYDNVTREGSSSDTYFPSLPGVTAYW